MYFFSLISVMIFSLIFYASLALPQHQQQELKGYTQLKDAQLKYLQNNKGFGSTHKTFRPTVAYEETEDEEEEFIDNAPEPTQEREPTYVTKTGYYATVTPKNYVINTNNNNNNNKEQRRIAQNNNRLQQIAEEEEEEEEPDRLTLLLPQSKFQCNGKKTGYYADEALGCEIFHYCHENARHSWICPEGFTFHQIQLICMPPGGDNICEKSSDYHFVNEYLYKPINLEEYQQRPNTSLRYSDRYFPESYRPRYDDEYDEQDERPVHRKHSIRVNQAAPSRVHHQQPQQQQQQQQQLPSTTFRPQSPLLGQVFRSPEEINISLQQRRPQYATPKYLYDNN